MWDEVYKLAAELQRTQRSKTGVLSEGSCVDIIELIIARKLTTLYHSLDGRYYFTPEQLRCEIGECIRHYGRCTLDALQRFLQVDAYVLRPLAHELAKSTDIVEIHEEWFSRRHLEQLCEEVVSIVNERRRIRLLDLACQLNDVSLSLLNEVMKMDAFPKEEIEMIDDYVLVQAYKVLQTSQLLGALEACIRPTDALRLCDSLNIDRSLSTSIINEVKRTALLNGEFIGVNFIPKLYAEKQRLCMLEFLSTNGYVECCVLRGWGVINPKQLFETLFGDQIKFLEGCYITTGHLNRLVNDVEEVMTDKGFCDLQEILPTCFTQNDCLKFTQILVEEKMVNCYFIESTLMISDAMHTNILKEIDQLSGEIVTKSLKDKQLVGSLLQKPQVPASKPVRSGNKGRQKRKSVRQDDQDDAKAINVIPVESHDLHEILERVQISSHLIATVARHYISVLRDLVGNKLKLELSKIASEGEAVNGPKVVQASCNDVLSALEEIELISRGIEQISLIDGFNGDQFVSDCNAYLLRNYGKELLNTIVGIKCGDLVPSEGTVPSLSAQERRRIVASMAKKDKDNIQLFENLLGQAKDGNEFLSSCVGPIEDLLGLSYNGLDKKKAREIGLKAREMLKTKLESETDISQALRQAVILIVYAARSVYLPLPGRMVPSLLELAEKSLRDKKDVKELRETYGVKRQKEGIGHRATTLSINMTKLRDKNDARGRGSPLSLRIRHD